MSKQMEVTKKKIGEYTFYIRPFPAFVAANISGELSKIAAPVLGALAPVLGGNGDKGALDTELDTALPAFGNALSSLSGDQFEKLVKRLIVDYDNVAVSGEITKDEAVSLDKNLADEVFCGEIQDMFILCWEVIKVNFGGFFKKVGIRFGSQQGITVALKDQINMASST